MAVIEDRDALTALVAELAKRVRELEIKDQATGAMHRYWRVLDYKLFDELDDCFTEDADADWGTADWQAIGRQAIVDFLHANESRSDLRLSHFGHNTEITVLSDSEATGIFKLEDWVTIGGLTVMRGFGQYNMAFRKGEDGRFRISRLRLLHDYREENRIFIDGGMLSMTPSLDA